MHLFARAVINGVGLALGALLVRKAAKRLGIDDPAYPAPAAQAVAPAPSNGDPGDGTPVSARS